MKRTFPPIGGDGSRFDLVEDTLAKIESLAASIYPELLAFRPLTEVAKLDFAIFFATMFTRSPAQIRQFAQLMGQMALWGGKHEMERDVRQKESKGEISASELAVRKILHNNDLWNWLPSMFWIASTVGDRSPNTVPKTFFCVVKFSGISSSMFTSANAKPKNTTW